MRVLRWAALMCGEFVRGSATFSPKQASMRALTLYERLYLFSITFALVYLSTVSPYHGNTGPRLPVVLDRVLDREIASIDGSTRATLPQCSLSASCSIDSHRKAKIME